jgi:hypothetical protein
MTFRSSQKIREPAPAARICFLLDSPDEQELIPTVGSALSA